MVTIGIHPRQIKWLIVYFAVILFAPVQAFADYYVIRLNNGKEIVVQKYWDEGPKIRFYRDGGSVAISKEDIKDIGKQGGTPAEPGADAKTQEIKNLVADIIELKKEKAIEEIDATKNRKALLIKKYGSTDAEKILNKEIWIGMTSEMAIEALGSPGANNRTVGSWGVHEQWVYYSNDIPTDYYYFENGILTSYQY